MTYNVLSGTLSLYTTLQLNGEALSSAKHSIMSCSGFL